MFPLLDHQGQYHDQESSLLSDISLTGRFTFPSVTTRYSKVPGVVVRRVRLPYKNQQKVTTKSLLPSSAPTSWDDVRFLSIVTGPRHGFKTLWGRQVSRETLIYTQPKSFYGHRNEENRSWTSCKDRRLSNSKAMSHHLLGSRIYEKQYSQKRVPPKEWRILER